MDENKTRMASPIVREGRHLVDRAKSVAKVCGGEASLGYMQGYRQEGTPRQEKLFTGGGPGTVPAEVGEVLKKRSPS